MQRICKNMHKICTKKANKICKNMNKYAIYMQKYAKICSTFFPKKYAKICKNMQIICMLYAKTCKICNHDFYMQNMQKYAFPTLLMVTVTVTLEMLPKQVACGSLALS